MKATLISLIFLVQSLCFAQLASWNNDQFKQIETKSGRGKYIWLEANGANRYEEDTIMFFETGKVEVYLNDLNSDYEKVDREFRGKIPEELLCPLTNKLFVEPVKLSDGSVFEKQAIDKWFELFDVHPLNETKIQNKNYIKDYKTQLEVSDYFETVKNLLD
jgi:hypothetical protein